MRFARIISLLLSAALMITGLSVSVSANESTTNENAGIVMPAYEVAANPQSNLTISGTKAICDRHIFSSMRTILSCLI